MYDSDVKMPNRRNGMKAFVESKIAEFEQNNAPEASKEYNPNKFVTEANMSMEAMAAREQANNRYLSFAETVRNSLVVEAMYNLFQKSVEPTILESHTEKSIMRAIVNNYVTENGYDNIMRRMKTASIFMSETYHAIDKTAKTVLESVDKNNPETFKITPEMRDEFFAQLNYSDSQAIADAIHDRVSDSMQDFITANTKDHEDITAALQKAQEKIADVDPDDVQLKEYYEMKAKREVSKIRNAPKNVFHAMVSSISEAVLRDPNNHTEFMTEGHINMDKVVSRTSLMYTFMEMLNTTNLDTVNSAFIEQVIADLKN